jgi:hypothetical protein
MSLFSFFGAEKEASAVAMARGGIKSVTYIMSKLFHLGIRITLDNRIYLHGLHVYALGYHKKARKLFL